MAVPSAMSYATEIIINSGEPVMTLGGFSGSDNILTLAQFKQLVSDGAIRYAIINGGGVGNGNSEITSWIQANGTPVSQSEWSGTSTNNTTSSNSKVDRLQGVGGGGSIQLYDLKKQCKITKPKAPLVGAFVI